MLERQSRARVLGRPRADVLEPGTVDTLRRAGAGERLDRLGHPRDTITIAWRGRVIAVDTARLVGRRAMAYGQAAIQDDPYRAAGAAGIEVRFEVGGVRLAGLATDRPTVRYRWQGDDLDLATDFVAGCDGAHGACRQAIPAEDRLGHKRRCPFGWPGILSATPPLPIIVYATHQPGFGPCSMRGPGLTRYYAPCPIEDAVEGRPDDRFWAELLARLPADLAEQVAAGPAIERSVTPLRSFVGEPMRCGRLLLAGDAAHVVPPTGAKGLSLAVGGAAALARALARPLRRRRRAARHLRRVGPGAGLAGRPALVVAHDPPPPVPHRRSLRRPAEGCGARPSRRLAQGPGGDGRAGRRPGVGGGLCDLTRRPQRRALSPTQGVHTHARCHHPDGKPVDRLRPLGHPAVGGKQAVRDPGAPPAVRSASAPGLLGVQEIPVQGVCDQLWRTWSPPR